MAKQKKSVKAVPKKSATKAAARRVAVKRAPRPAPPTRRAPGRSADLLTVSPGLTVNDVGQSIAWYRDVLGFAVKELWEKDGKVMGAEMRAGAVSFNLGQDDWKMGRDRVKGQGTRMYITTGPSIDRLADGIKARGGTLTSEPREEWGMRAFSIDDPDGYKLTFLFPLKKVGRPAGA
ncbi:MAG: VOC family protein [Vicinamibacterales bacterium]